VALLLAIKRPGVIDLEAGRLGGVLDCSPNGGVGIVKDKRSPRLRFQNPMHFA